MIYFYVFFFSFDDEREGFVWKVNVFLHVDSILTICPTFPEEFGEIKALVPKERTLGACNTFCSWW